MMTHTALAALLLTATTTHASAARVGGEDIQTEARSVQAMSTQESVWESDNPVLLPVKIIVAPVFTLIIAYHLSKF